MSTLESLPPRPLSEKDIAALNRSDVVELAIAVGDDEPTEGLLLATDDWVKGLAYVDDAWTVVETVPLDGTERFDALRTCEESVREAIGSGDTF